MLYCVLFHGTISDPNTASPKDSYAENTIQVAIQSLRFFNSFAVLDLPAFQVTNVLQLLLSVKMLITAYILTQFVLLGLSYIRNVYELVVYVFSCTKLLIVISTF